MIKPEDLTLLGAPVLPCANEKVLSAKLDSLKTLTDRLKLLNEHDALYLLKNCMAIPKLLYFLRTALCFLNPNLLAEYDETIKTGLENILNVKMTDQIWDQVSLPTKLGGFGIRKTTELAISGYLSSVSAVEQGVKDLLGYDPNSTPLHIAAQIPTFGDGLIAFHDTSLENSQDVGLTQLHLVDVTSIQHQDDGDINPMSISGVTPLHDAAGNGSGDINPMSNSGVTPLHDAARNECGDINPVSNSGVTPLHDAARNECGSYFELAKRLWKNKVGNSVEFPKNPKIQKEWDLKMCQSMFDS